MDSSETRTLRRALILNELISWLRRSKRKLFLLKIDFQKAFDCLNCAYLDKLIEQMKFSAKCRGWIRIVLASARTSILMHGSPSPEFAMERGVRHGEAADKGISRECSSLTRVQKFLIYNMRTTRYSLAA